TPTTSGSLGDLTDLAGSLKTHGQKQAITVMNRDAYIKANPQRETDLEPDTTHVVIDGSSRLAAAREAGLDTLKVMVSDDQGATSEELLESALVANIHRQDLDELDEARALERLLAIHGSQRALARRLHRSQGWVSQRLALLNLTPELQAKIGTEAIDMLRAVGNRPAAEQEAALEQLKQERARREADKRGRSAGQPAAPSGPAAQESVTSGGDYAVITPAEPSRPSSSATIHRTGDSERVPHQTGPDTREVPLPPGTGEQPTSEERPVRKVPYDQPGALAMLLDTKIESDETFFDLFRCLGVRALERSPSRLRELARSLVEQTDDARLG
ncbi:ParB/RepB/Spo0J family partition protein, partial [Streptomyces sp. C1-2]|nr:ParB/RepB/Spo0J family partition protein [Streptomyces sp. C1-2]